ncbi:cell wall-binding repeat-containing protein [Herbiconiux sp. 11R-BC]|uniref:cell wall-binding repeat-containing protein n=1 Tax=Herbiconiux sp. 11R-BC TaxID=3111637 RepID=UPI003C0329F5
MTLRTSTRAAIAAAAALVLAPALLTATAAHADPTGVADDYVLSAGALFTTPAGHGVLANDVGVVLNTLIDVSAAPAHGVLTMNLDGTFSYLPVAGYVGVDTFSYCLKLVVGPCLTPAVSVHLTINATIERIGGADRYAVSAGVAHEFATEGGTVYVASGEVFPDALSASAAAGAQGAPVLLVAHDTIPALVGAELSRLQPQRIVLVGGLNTVSAAVETALGAYSSDVVRLTGADRFAVSAAVSLDAFGANRPIAYIASGGVFPDALSGSAAAGRLGGPVLLVSHDTVSAEVKTELTRLHPAKIVVLGGTNTVADGVLTTLAGFTPGTVTRVGGADRYAVSAAIAAGFPESDTHTLYVASGEVFPDALSGSAAAIKNGAPVLLVTRDSVPADVAAQLTRLHPLHIVVLGGPNTVSPANYTAIGGYLGH